LFCQAEPVVVVDKWEKLSFVAAKKELFQVHPFKSRR
jgi:hypothetical protein